MQRTLLTPRDALEEESGACLVNRQVAQFVEDAQCGFGVLLQCRFETAGPLGGGQCVDDLNGTGKEPRVALEAGGIAQCRRQMGLPQTPTSQQDTVGFLLEKRQAKVLLDLEAVNPGGPVPPELLQGFADGDARQPHAALGGALAPQVGLACHESRQGVDLRPHFLCGWCGQLCRVLRHAGELPVAQMVRHVASGRCGRRSIVAFSQGVRLLCILGCGLGSRLIQTESRWCEPDRQKVVAPCQMESAGRGGKAGAWRQQVRDVLCRAGLVGKGSIHGAGHGLRSVEVAQGDNFAYGVRGIQATGVALKGIRLGPRREGEKAPEERGIARFFALGEEGWGVIRLCASLEAIIASDVASNELVPVVETAPIGRGFAREGVAGIVGRPRIAIGVEGNATLPGGSDLRHRGGITRMPRQRAQRGALLLP